MKPSDCPTFSKIYPAIVQWASGWGWVEIGEDGRMNRFVRALDEGGMVLEIPIRGSLDKALDKIETASHKFITDIS